MQGGLGGQFRFKRELLLLGLLEPLCFGGQLRQFALEVSHQLVKLAVPLLVLCCQLLFPLTSQAQQLGLLRFYFICKRIVVAAEVAKAVGVL